MFNKKEWSQNYAKTYRGKKSYRINKWKHRGLIAINYELIYDRWYYSSHCENCKCEYTTKNKKCMDHNHDTGLFRNILCNNCNKNLQDNNKSGIPNICWRNSNKCWLYSRVINGKRHYKNSKDLEWLKNYKKEFELKHIYIH